MVKKNVIKTIISTINKLIESLDLVFKFLIEGFSITTEFIPYVTDSMDFFQFFAPLFLLMYILLEIYNTL